MNAPSNVHPIDPHRVNVAGPIMDTLVNLLSGLGTAKDKTTQTRFTMNLLDQSQTILAYRGDWIARKIIDCPAQDSTREWRMWQAEKKDITEIEKTEKDIKLQSKVRQVMARARLYGGAALVLGVNQGSPDQELKVDKVRQGQLQYVHVVNRSDLSTERLNTDVTSPYYGEPESYSVTSALSGVVKIHPSRVIRFIGNEIPDINLAPDGWGDSVLQTIYDAVIQAGQTAANVASIVNEAKVDVVQIPNLMQSMGTAEYRSLLIERFTLANSMKSLTNTLILDKEEEWNRLNASFAGLPDIIRMYLLMASGAADIPATRLLGQSASGLNATGQEDTRNYYDRLSSDQRNDLGPRLDRLDEVMMRSTFGDKPDEVTYTWNSLWQLSDTEAADVAVKKATVYTADVNAGLLPPEVMREARENQLIEDETYPGLEMAIDEYGEQNLDEYNQAVVAQMGARAALMAPDDPNDPKGGSKKAAAAKAELARRKALPPPRPPAARSQDRRTHMLDWNPTSDGWLRREFDRANAAIWKDGGPYPEPRFAEDETKSRTWVDDYRVWKGDARYTPFTEDETTPRSLYVRRDVLNGEEILAHFAEQGVDVSGVDPEDLHVTVLCSRQPVDWIKMGEANNYVQPGGDNENEDYDMCIRAGGPRVMEAWGVPPDTLVMCFASSQLCYRHQDMVYRGASEDYEDYNPHVSIAAWSGVDPRTIEPWQGEIYLGPEIFQPVKQGGAGGVAADFDPSELRNRSGEWTRGGAASKQARVDKILEEQRKRAEGDVGARLKRTREAAVAKAKRIAAAAARKAAKLAKSAVGDEQTFDTLVTDWRHALSDYSPEQPRVPGGQQGGGQFATSGGTYGAALKKAGIYTTFVKVKRLSSGNSFNAIYKKPDINPAGNPQTIEVAQQVKGVRGKWNKNTDQGGDYAAGAGWLMLKDEPSLGKLAEQFWRDAAEFMTPREYDYAKSYFATRDTAFMEGFRATYSPNGRAFGLSRARTSEVFGRATENMRGGVNAAFAPAKPGPVERVGKRLARFFGAQ